MNWYRRLAALAADYHGWLYWLLQGLIIGLIMVLFWKWAATGRVELDARRLAMGLLGCPLGALIGGYYLGGRWFPDNWHLRMILGWFFMLGVGPGIVLAVIWAVGRLWPRP